MSSNDSRLQVTFNQNQFTSSASSATTSSSVYASSASVNQSADLDLNQYGDDSMIALVLGDLDFLMMTETDQQQQQQQVVQPNLYQQPTTYQTQSSSQPQQQQPAGSYDNRGGMSMNQTGLSSVNLVDLHDEQSERIKSEVLGTFTWSWYCGVY